MKCVAYLTAFSNFRQLASLLCCGILFTAGCQTKESMPQTVELARAPSVTASPAPNLTSTSVPSLPAVLPSPSPPQDSILQLKVCSPLEGVLVDQLAEHISNPFSPPPAGSDDPHQGVDLADTGVEGIARQGLQVNSVLPGQVAAVIQQRFPYGNALLVESRLDSLPVDWLARLALPGHEESPSAGTTLTCPEPSIEPEWDNENYSLYLLYAHLQSPPVFELGDEIGCGQMVGRIGSSGNALNPHLHLEIRTGPAGARFASMAHYDPSASIDEMATYCTWRVSGDFRLLDPMSLFSLP